MNYQTALIQLPLLCEVAKRRIDSPDDTALVCADMSELAQESFHVLLLNARNGLLNRQLISMGAVNSTLVHAREVFRAACAQAAVSMILVHNHPSGDPTPSAEDLCLTRKLVEAGRVMGIRILDHVIIGRKSETCKGYMSLRERGLCNFEAE